MYRCRRAAKYPSVILTSFTDINNSEFSDGLTVGVTVITYKYLFYK